MKIKIIDNFIEDSKVFNDLKNLLTSNQFPQYYVKDTGYPGDDSDFLFCHILYYEGKQTSNYFNRVAMPLLGRMKFNYLDRIKVNLYTKKHKIIHTAMHTDMNGIPHTVGIYSVNTNNGYTLFEDGQKVESVENRLAIFDGNMKHCSVSQTDTNIRVNINMNFTNQLV